MQSKFWRTAKAIGLALAVFAATTTAYASYSGNGPFQILFSALGSVAAGTAGTQSDLTGCVYNSAAPAPTDGQQLGTQCDASGNAKVDLVTPLPAGTNTIGAVAPAAASNGGATPYHYLSAASNNATLVSSGAHTVYALALINTTATVYYFRLYDSGSAPSCSSATGVVDNLPVPANANGAGVVIPLEVGASLANGLAFCLTGGGGDNDNSDAAAGVYVNLWYK